MTVNMEKMLGVLDLLDYDDLKIIKEMAEEKINRIDDYCEDQGIADE